MRSHIVCMHVGTGVAPYWFDHYEVVGVGVNNYCVFISVCTS